MGPQFPHLCSGDDDNMCLMKLRALKTYQNFRERACHIVLCKCVLSKTLRASWVPGMVLGGLLVADVRPMEKEEETAESKTCHACESCNCVKILHQNTDSRAAIGCQYFGQIGVLQAPGYLLGCARLQ